jgi:TPR repeat protein
VEVTLDQGALDEAIRKAKEFEALLARAEGGDGEAQFELAERYAFGRDVEKSPEEAKKWYLRAADSGHEKSRELLVASYIRGTLTGYEPKTDFVRLLPWMKDAARAGNVVVMQILAEKYSRGEEVAQDLWEAHRWLQALAERGFVNAQYSLALMYHQGLGVEPNAATAYKWFEAAAMQGDNRAQYMVAMMNYYGRGVEQNLRAAKEWASRAAQQDDSEFKREAVALVHTLDAIEAGRGTSPPSLQSPPTAPAHPAQTPAIPVGTSSSALPAADSTPPGVPQGGAAPGSKP